MTTEIYLNSRKFKALTFEQETDAVNSRMKIRFDFHVTSEDYHDIAMLLYEMQFRIRVPEKGLDFPGSITNYITSRTNLYEPGNVAEYHLELTETD